MGLVARTCSRRYSGVSACVRHQGQCGAAAAVNKPPLLLLGKNSAVEKSEPITSSGTCSFLIRSLLRSYYGSFIPPLYMERNKVQHRQDNRKFSPMLLQSFLYEFSFFSIIFCNILLCFHTAQVSHRAVLMPPSSY